MSRSKGCGLVTYATPAEAQLAVKQLNNTALSGRNIFIREDREGPDPWSGFGGKGQSKGKGGGAPSSGDPTCRVYVGNLAYSASWQDVKDHFKVAGNVTRCDILSAPGTAMGSKGCGIVEFSTQAEAQYAIATLNNSDLKGRPIFVREDREGGAGAPGMKTEPMTAGLMQNGLAGVDMSALGMMGAMAGMGVAQ